MRLLSLAPEASASAVSPPERMEYLLYFFNPVRFNIPSFDANKSSRRSAYCGRCDAFHIGIAAAHQIEYLLTWNCKHIANATMRGTIEAICRSSGLTPPIICTPEELPSGSSI